MDTCYGYTIHASQQLSYARRGGGDADLEVRITADDPQPGPLITTWRPRSGDTVQARLYGDVEAGQFQLWIEAAGWFRVDTRNRVIDAPSMAAMARVEERLWGIPALLCLQRRGDLPLHAAAMEVDDRALLLAGPSFHGKTTLAAACAKAGARLLSEDLACIRLGRHVTVVPGPAMLRLRLDVAERIRVPGTHRTLPDDERVHLAFANPGSGDPVPLEAVILLRPGDGPPRLAPTSPTRALPDLWALSWHPPTSEQHARCFEMLTDLVTRVPVWDLHRPIQMEALHETAAAVVGAGARARA